MGRIRYPRIQREEVARLLRAHEDVSATIMMLNDAKWAGAVPAIVALQRADQVIAALFNRVEPAYLAGGRGKSRAISQERSQKISAGVATAGNPGADQGGALEPKATEAS
jgi:hypothetical protein